MRSFGVAGAARGMEDVPVRSAFLVGEDGIIRGAWRYEPAEIPDVDALLEAARALR